MNAELKGYCLHCNGPMEFPDEMRGQIINCPHCQQPTTLREINNPTTVMQQHSQSTTGNRSHGVFYYVFWGTVSLLATVFILGIGCIIIGIGVPAFVSGAKHAHQNHSSSSSRDQKEAEEQNYISSNILVYDFSASYHESVLDGRIPGVDFKIKNNGDRTLKEIKVTVYFKDSENHTISEETFFPVMDNSIESQGSLKPGYIWQMERGKFYGAKHVPSEWKEGNASIEISNVEFK